MHIGVFILLLLSGERNFGVRLNKPYTSRYLRRETFFDFVNDADDLFPRFETICC